MSENKIEKTKKTKAKTNKNEQVKMTKIEKEEWESLYEYVKKDILQYDDNQSIGRHMILRLKGLHYGQYIRNNKAKNTASYSYNVIKLTFMYKKQDIIQAMQRQTFNSEEHRINYIMAIIDSSINDIYKRLQRAEQQKQAKEGHDYSNLFTDSATLQKKSKGINEVKLSRRARGVLEGKDE